MLGLSINERQKRAEISDAEFARRMDTTQTQLKKLKDRGDKLDLHWLRRMAKALGCAVVDLLDSSDAPNRISAEDATLLKPLLSRGADTTREMLDAVSAIDKLVEHEVERRVVRKASSSAKPSQAEELSQLWANLSETDRVRLLEIVRMASAMAGRLSRHAA